MTPRQVKESINLNTIIGSLTVLGMIVTGVFFIAPLRDLPNQQDRIEGDLGDMKRTQAVQSEALRTLAEVAKESRDLRREFDNFTGRSLAKDQALGDILRRLERLENR